MEEENKKQISNKKAIIAIIAVIILLIILVLVYSFVLKPTKDNDIVIPTPTGSSSTYTDYSYTPTEEFNKLNEYDNFTAYCTGEKEILFNGKNVNNGIIINTYEELSNYIDECEDRGHSIRSLIWNKFNIDWDKNSFIIYNYFNETSVAGVKVTDIINSNNNTNVKLAISEGQPVGDTGSYVIQLGDTGPHIGANAEMIFILTDKLQDDTKLNFEINRYNAELKSEEKIISADYKPIIYIYPTEETKVSVKVGRPENLSHTYPKYENGWEVIAKPNGDLIDTKTGRNLYALYWEGKNIVEPNMNEGFIVKGEDTITFLEEKLKVLGLNEREANEFIIYWLPKLESNKYNFIRFQTEEEINNNMPLAIEPKPDTVIRVVMEFKGIEEPIQVQEQNLKTPKRIGYTVVEWGGTEIK